MFPDATTSPVERFELATNDVYRAHEALRETYSDHEVQLRGDAEHFAYRQLTAVAGPLAADQIGHTMRVTVTADPLPCLTSLLVVDGDLAIRAGREETELGPGDVVLSRLGLRRTAPAHGQPVAPGRARRVRRGRPAGRIPAYGHLGQPAA